MRVFDWFIAGAVALLYSYIAESEQDDAGLDAAFDPATDSTIGIAFSIEGEWFVDWPVIASMIALLCFVIGGYKQSQIDKSEYRQTANSRTYAYATIRWYRKLSGWKQLLLQSLGLVIWGLLAYIIFNLFHIIADAIYFEGQVLEILRAVDVSLSEGEMEGVPSVIIAILTFSSSGFVFLWLTYRVADYLGKRFFYD